MGNSNVDSKHQLWTLKQWPATLCLFHSIAKRRLIKTICLQFFEDASRCWYNIPSIPEIQTPFDQYHIRYSSENYTFDRKSLPAIRFTSSPETKETRSNSTQLMFHHNQNLSLWINLVFFKKKTILTIGCGELLLLPVNNQIVIVYFNVINYASLLWYDDNFSDNWLW